MLYTEKIQLNLSEEDFHKMVERYHYEEKHLNMLMHLYYAIEPAIDGWCCYETEPQFYFLDDEPHVSVLVTLGKGIDCIQEAYQETGCIEEAYMLDCIGWELLWVAYGKVRQILQESQGLWQTDMEFIGERCPMEEIATVVDYMGAKWDEIYHAEGQGSFADRIKYNESYLLSPGKSVVYIAKVEKNKPKHQRDIDIQVCDKCGNLSCPNRCEGIREYNGDCPREERDSKKRNGDSGGVNREPKGNNGKWTYGYQTIFRKKDMTDDGKGK